MLDRVKDWRTTVPGIALSGLITYFCPDLVKDLTTPQGIFTALTVLGPALLGVLSHGKGVPSAQTGDSPK